MMRHALNQTCDILRQASQTADAWGNTDGAYTASTEDVNCRKVQLKQPIEIEFAGEVYPIQYALWVDYGTDVRIGDRVLLGSTYYDVVGFNDDPGARQYFATVYLREVA